MKMNDSGRLTRAELRDALQHADLRVLLMVLVHLTGDMAWLEAPYLPARDVRLIPDPSAGLPPCVQEEIRNAALAAIATWSGPAMADPGDALMHRMMSVCLGEDVPPEYAALNREEMGLKTRQPVLTGDLPGQVLIVGAGISGIALAVSLKNLGVPFVIVEKNPDAGGTWFRNRYPGCGVDTPNHSYSFSFGPRYRWSRYFSRRQEVQAYISKVIAEFDLAPHIRYETELTSACWSEDRQCWTSVLQSAAGTQTFDSAFLVSAIGQLSDPMVPDIAGASSFTGPIFHSVDWPEELDVSNKRVAVIGTGATAMQLVPSIAGTASFVDVYQRTPQWSRSIPGYADMISPGEQLLLEHVPFYAQWFRFNMFWRYGDGLLKCLKKDPDWIHPERSVNAINDRHRQEMTEFIHEQLEGREDLVAQCVPSYPPYGKRILLDNGWYKTIRRDDVALISDSISRIGPDYVETADGQRRPVDIVVYSTGFKLTEMAARLNITGRDSRRLADEWAGDNPSAYLGLVVPGFPNFFCMLGPGSGPAHGGSAVFQAECQSRYVTSCLTQMAKQSASSIDVRRDVCQDYLNRVDAEHETLIWTHPGMSTYYRNGKGRVFSVMPWRFVDYWQMTHDANLDEFMVRQHLTSELAYS